MMVVQRLKLYSRLPTNWPGSVMQCWRAGTIISLCTKLLCFPTRRSGFLDSYRRSLQKKRRRKHSQTACLKTCGVTRCFTTVAIGKDRHARIIIMRPENILHSEAGYIFADCSRRNRFFLQFGGEPYMLRQLTAIRSLLRPFGLVGLNLAVA